MDRSTIDLMAEDLTAGRAHGPSRERGRIDPAMVVVTGLGAGLIATAAQFVLWWLAEMPLPETLFRDARLTAALIMGSAVLPPPSTARWDILLVATLIHFSLSIVYAVISVRVFARLPGGGALLAGAFYGLLIYVVNMYGVTVIFPWFSMVRDWVTLVAHLVFGVTLAGGCRWYRGRQRFVKDTIPRVSPPA